MTVDSRILGCVVGGALGDAYGGPYEGQTPPIRIDEQASWRLSDDTQLTLATCEAITRTGKVDPAAIAEQFKEWFLARRLSGLGASTLKALTELAHGGHWASVGRRGETAAGNGAAMRIAPLAFLLDPGDANDRRTIRDVCRITHHSEEAYAGALAVVMSLRKAWDGTWSGGPGLIEQIVELLFDCRVRDRLHEISQVDAHAGLPTSPPDSAVRATPSNPFLWQSAAPLEYSRSGSRPCSNNSSAAAVTRTPSRRWPVRSRGPWCDTKDCHGPCWIACPMQAGSRALPEISAAAWPEDGHPHDGTSQQRCHGRVVGAVSTPRVGKPPSGLSASRQRFSRSSLPGTGSGTGHT